MPWTSLCDYTDMHADNIRVYIFTEARCWQESTDETAEELDAEAVERTHAVGCAFSQPGK